MSLPKAKANGKTHHIDFLLSQSLDLWRNYKIIFVLVRQVLIEVPYVFVQAGVYGVIVYALVDFQWTAAKFFWYFYMMFFTLLYNTFYGFTMVGLRS